MIGYGSIRPVQVLWVVMLVATALVLGGCGGDSGPAAAPQGTISGVTYDAATGNPTDEPIVIAMAQSQVRATSEGIKAAQASPGAYTINVPPGTYAIQCYVEHNGEQYFGDKIEDVVVLSSYDTSGQDLTAPSVITAHTYGSSGDLVAGWHWLRDNPPPPPGWTDGSNWSFSRINRDRDITAHFMMLVTNQVSGGAGYDTTIDVYYMGNLAPSSVNLYLPPSGNPPDNQYPPFPEGYATRTTQEVNQNYVTDDPPGDLYISVARIQGNTEHVATRQDSIWLVNY